MIKTEKSVFAFYFPTPEDVAAKTRADLPYGFSSASFDVSIVRIEDGDKVRNVRDDLSAAANLCMRVHLWRSESGALDPSVSVEWRDVYSIGLERAQTMAKFASKIQRALERFDAEDGHSYEWGELIRRYALAIGVRKCVRRNGPRRGGAYDDNAHDIRPIAEAIRMAEDIRAAVDPIVKRRDVAA